MNLRPLLPLLSLASLIGLAGCSSSSSSHANGGDAGSDATTGPTIDKVAADVASAYCARAQACAPAFVSIGYGDVATCTATFAADVTRAFKGTGVTETPAQIALCAAAVPQLSCGDLLARRTAPACKPPAGTLADGAACAADAQCQGTRCKIAFGQVCGTCTTHVAAGAACGVDDDCDTGMMCLAATCVAFGDEKATCDATHPCRPDLACNSGACGAPNAVGAACTAPDQCNAANGIVCNPQSKKCDTLSLGGPRAPCGFVAGHVASCMSAAACVGATAPKFQGTCTTAAAPGAACDTSAGPTCGPGAACVCSSNVDGGCIGTCKQRDPAACH